MSYSVPKPEGEAPLYADNERIVRAVLKEVIHETRKDSSPERKVAMLEIASAGNPLAEELNATILLELHRMYTKGLLEFAQKNRRSTASALVN